MGDGVMKIGCRRGRCIRCRRSRRGLSKDDNGGRREGGGPGDSGEEKGCSGKVRIGVDECRGVDNREQWKRAISTVML